MAIFSKGKGSKTQKSSTPAEPPAPVERVMYVPKYAVRDAMQCTPNASKLEHKDALRKAHEARAIREEYEKSMHSYALSNPKMAVSRNSSAPSTPFGEGSRASSSRIINPFASSSTSSLSIPSLVHTTPSVPMIPEQYSASNSSAGPSTPSLSRSSSYHTRPQIQSREGHLNVPATSRNSSGSWSQSSSSLGAPATVSMSKNALRGSIGTQQTWPALTAILGETPWELPEEVVDMTTAESSDVSSRSSSTADAEVLELAPRFDSTQPSPVLPDTDRFYPHDPRKLGKAPVITSLKLTEATAPLPPQANKYVPPASKPISAAPVAATPPIPVKKPRFSLIRRSHVVSAH